LPISQGVHTERLGVVSGEAGIFEIAGDVEHKSELALLTGKTRRFERIAGEGDGGAERLASTDRAGRVDRCARGATSAGAASARSAASAAAAPRAATPSAPASTGGSSGRFTCSTTGSCGAITITAGCSGGTRALLCPLSTTIASNGKKTEATAIGPHSATAGVGLCWGRRFAERSFGQRIRRGGVSRVSSTSKTRYPTGDEIAAGFRAARAGAAVGVCSFATSTT
jgi:hypothetical protein